MLSFVAIPFDILRPLKLRHRWLMQIMAAYANPAGRCYPSREEIAASAGEHLSWVKRVMPEAIELGYLSREPREGGGYMYTIAERFRPPAKPALRAVQGGLKQARRGPILNAGGPKTGPEVDSEEDSYLPLTPSKGDQMRSRFKGANPRAVGTNPRAQGTNPRAVGTNPRGESEAGGAIPNDKVAAEIKQRGELRALFERNHWPERQGPRPGEAGCLYPPALITEVRQRVNRR